MAVAAVLRRVQLAVSWYASLLWMLIMLMHALTDLCSVNWIAVKLESKPRYDQSDNASRYSVACMYNGTQCNSGSAHLPF
jgi:hypothetical protein